MPEYSVGIDFGTLSARAVLVDISTGETVAQSVFGYPNAVMETRLPSGAALPPGFALQDPRDYLTALERTVRGVMAQSAADPADVVGVGIDFTSATILPVYKDKTPLCAAAEFENEPHAYVKLWKHHGAEEEADLITAAAEKRGEEWLSLYGGRVSCEWTLPKIFETLRRAPRVFEAADLFLEAMDWIVWNITGSLSASACAMGYKAFYQDGRFPDGEFFGALDPRLRGLAEKKLPRPILPVGDRAGTLTPEAAEKLGLPAGTPVGVPMIDAHCSLLGSGIVAPGDLMIILGTSAGHIALSEKRPKIPGIQGVVKDGVIPGFYGVEAGQSCVGEHFAWVAQNLFPEEYAEEARKKGFDRHRLLTEKLRGYKAGESGLIALDWFNGVRTPLMDFDLGGLILGLDLHTKPEDVYLALMEATAYGARAIAEEYENAGIKVNGIVLSGGVPAKNPFVIQLYADVLDRPVRVCADDQVCALGAAFLGAAAARKYGTVNEIAAKLGRVRDGIYAPSPSQAAVYDELYKEYKALADHFGRGGSDVMKKLRRLRAGRAAP